MSPKDPEAKRVYDAARRAARHERLGTKPRRKGLDLEKQRARNKRFRESEARRAYDVAYRADHFEQMKAASIRWRLKQMGLTVEDYNRILLEQDSVCAICKKLCASGFRLAVDHDWSCCAGDRSCGKCVRGLLCRRCNQVIGKFEHDPEILDSAALYLRRSNG